MKGSKRNKYKRWLSSQNENASSDEEKLLGMASQTLPDTREDLDFDLSLQIITSKWPDFDIANEKKELSPNTDAHFALSPIAASITHFPSPTGQPKASSPLTRIKRIFTKFPVRDPSWLTASSFTIGSAVFVINGFFLLLPMVQPGWNFEGEATYAGPATSVLGTFIFLIGGWTSILEAQNMKRGELEGVGVEDEDEDEENKNGKSDGNTSPQVLELNDDGASISSLVIEHHYTTMTSVTLPAQIGGSAFIWWPSLAELRTIYFHDPMFTAAAIQMVGAIIFAIATITAIPGVMDLTNNTLLYTLSLLPAFVGGLCFLASGAIQTIGAQDKWYIPTPWRLEWHVGFWNSIGSIGFALAGGLLYIGDKAAFQATLADFWGSWGFMIGSAIQWYVVMANYP